LSLGFEPDSFNIKAPYLTKEYIANKVEDGFLVELKDISELPFKVYKIDGTTGIAAATNYMKDIV